MGKIEHPGQDLTTAAPARRQFLRHSVGLAAGGGLLLGVGLPAAAARLGETDDGQLGPFAPNAFLRIDRKGNVTLVMPYVEMGQGTYTAIPMLIAEELEVDLGRVTIEHAPPSDALYKNPLLGMQVTGGSTSIRASWDSMRMAGATARVMLIQAAAQRWGVTPASCVARHGMVLHTASRRSLHYGELAEAAARLPVPDKVALKQPAEFRLVGKPQHRLDTPAKTDGTARFGIDALPPGVRFAAVAACPTFGGKLRDVDEARALAVPGVLQVVRLDDAVAVVGRHTWAAKQGLAAANPSWDAGPNAQVGMPQIIEALDAATRKPGAVARSSGDAQAALQAAPRRVEAVYQQPFLAHATMEPMNCTVHARPDGVDVWVGTQVPSLAQAVVARATGVDAKDVRIHNQLLGGGFGRRLEIDGVLRAALIAKHVDAPVKVIWSREEDIQHDLYRPYYFDRIAAGLDASGKPVAWSHHFAGSSIMARFFPAAVKDGIDPDAVESSENQPYAVGDIQVTWAATEPPAVPTAFWRGVGPTRGTFVVESFIDELAAAAGQDPLAYRLALLGQQPRAAAVLKLAAERAGWGQPLPKGQGRGIALCTGWNSFIAQVVEVAIQPDQSVKLQKVVCAVDCGLTVNPDTVRAQLEGGVVFGLSAVMFGEITVKNGRVEQNNFGDYRLLRMKETPPIEVHLVQSLEAPGGIGEPGTSCVMPAFTNAVFAASGKRIRTLPLGDQLQA